MSGRIQVVAAFIVENDRVMLAQRGLDDAYGGMWECPGGKVDPEDDSMWAALQRELREELDLEVEPVVPGRVEAFFTSCHYTPVDVFDADIHFIACKRRYPLSPPKLIEAAGVGWFNWYDVSLLLFAAATRRDVLTPANVRLFKMLDRAGACLDWREL